MSDLRTEPSDDQPAEPAPADFQPAEPGPAAPWAAESGAAEPWTEPRGPHLPDAMARIPRLAWPFILLAAARLAWAVNQADFGPVPELSRIVSYVIGSIPPMVAVLLPVALVFRQPDAANRARTLLVGAILIAVAEGLMVLAGPLGPIFEQLTPGSAETPFLIPVSIGYDALASLVGTFGVANLALGLAQARRYEDRAGARVIAVVFSVVAVLIAASRIVEVTQLSFGQFPMTPTLVAYIGTTVALGILAVFAWCYLAATVVRGVRAGEEPGSGWTAGALGAGLVVVASLFFAALLFIAALIRPTPDTQPLYEAVGRATSGADALGYLFLLGAFAAGLPSLDEVEVEEEVRGDDDGDEPRTHETEAAGLAAGLADFNGSNDSPTYR